MLNRIMIGGLGLTLLSFTAIASQPIDDVDALESRYIACLESELADNCLEQTFSSHELPWHQPVDLKEVTSFIAEWSGKDGIYKVHPIEKETVGAVVQKRWYLIEKERGDLMLLTVRFRAVKGQWYYANSQVSNDADVLGPVVLDSTTPSPL